MVTNLRLLICHGCFRHSRYTLTDALTQILIDVGVALQQFERVAIVLVSCSRMFSYTYVSAAPFHSPRPNTFAAPENASIPAILSVCTAIW